MEAMLKGEVPMPAHLAAPLGLASGITRLGMALRRARTPVRVPARVISIGNITMGGTGKTPAVIARAEAEIATGRKVAVVTRGYGAPKTVLEPFCVGVGERAAWEEVGDEAALIRLRVPGVALVRAADRVAGARAAVEQFGCDTILLDDGFQAVQLHRDEDIVLIDATCPFGNRRIVPAGYLREPLAALRRATEIVITRADQAGDLAGLRGELAALAPGVPVRATIHAPLGLLRLKDQALLPLETLRGMEITALCGIGNPGSCLAGLERRGARVVEKIILADHAVTSGLAGAGKRPLVMTEKDAVKVREAGREVYSLRIGLQPL